MHEGVHEDGVLSTCGICGCQVHMLDPEEQDWICDPCSMEGWSGFKSAWRLTPGDVIWLGQASATILAVEDHARLRWLTLRYEDGDQGNAGISQTRKVYVHTDRQPIA